MSEDPELSPQTPRARSSGSVLFSAFKNLTGARQRYQDHSSNPSSPSPTTSPRDRPIEPTGGALTPKISHTSDVSSSPSLANQFHDASQDSRAIMTAELVGGPPELSTSLMHLDVGRPMHERIGAAMSVANILDNYKVDNTTKVWEMAKDLVSHGEEAGATQAAYQLLEACVSHRTLTSSERLFFFNTVQEDTSDTTFPYRIQVLRHLTHEGRDVDCLEEVLWPLLVQMLKRAFDTARSVRKLDKTSRASSRPNAEKSIQQVFEFTNDLIKYNSKTLTATSATFLLGQINAICNSTTSESDLASSLSIIDAIITYSSIPEPLGKDIVEILSGIYCQIGSLKQQSWKAIRKLLNSHQAAGTMVLLLDILRENPYKEDPKDHKYHSIRGAVLICDRIYSERDDDEFAARPSMQDLIPALHRSLVLGSSKLEANIMQLLLTILKSDEANELLENRDVWDGVIQIVAKCTRQPSSSKEASLDDASVPVAAKSYLQELADWLLLLVADQDFQHRHLVMELFLQVAPFVNDATAQVVVEHHLDERLLLPSSSNWLEHWQRLFQSFFKDKNRSSTVKMLTLRALLDAYNTAESLDDELANQLFLNILPSIGEEKDPMILSTLSRTAVDVATWTPNCEVFDAILNQLKTILHESESDVDAEVSPTVAVGSFGMIETTPVLKPPPDSFPVKVVKTTVRTFLRTLNRSAEKAEKLYNMLLEIAGSRNLAPDGRIAALKALFRLRADINHAIFLVPSTDSEQLAASLCRTEQSAVVSENNNHLIKPTKRDDSSSQINRRRSPSSSVTSLMSRGTSVSKRGPSRINKPTPPLWLYPGPKGLPEPPPSEVSRLVYSTETPLDDAELEISGLQKPKCVFNIGRWIELILSMLQQDNLDWEIYSYAIVHLGSQLTNHALFVDNEKQIKLLRSVLCQQLSTKAFMEPPSYTNLKKADVAICLYDSLTMLISYSHLFSKNEQDELVKVLHMGIGSWERSSESCIHALAICCHELPLSLTKQLEIILTRLTQTITQSQTAVHVLEFLAGLARLPELYRNFREQEFRMVFGICFRYLQYIREQQDKSTVERSFSARLSAKQAANVKDAPVEFDTPFATKKRSLADDLPSYPYALIYHVMTFWFMSLKMEDRPQQIPWIVKNLVTKDSHGLEFLDEQAQVCVDFMYRIAYSDRDDTVEDKNFAAPSDGPVSSKNWLSGSSILTIETAGRSGLSQITRRRPSGTRFSQYRPRFVDLPRHQVPIYTGLAAETYYSDAYVGILPDDIMQEFYSPANLTSAAALADYPVPLPDDEATQRTIRAFDKIPPLDGHKVGIIYVGEGQASESTILSNVMGSDDYVSFLTSIGTLIELKNANFNTQGLDREYDTDGKFTFCWRDRVSEIVFHVTTMMPTNLEHDPNCANKKKHIGNDFVNIIFNNSGLAYDMDTFPSAFNYVNIVITPEARASFIETRLRAKRRANAKSKPNVNGDNTTNAQADEDIDPLAPAPAIIAESSADDMYYKVTVLTKPGLPAISPASETKVISGRSLPAFVRLLALNASVFSLAWLNRDNETETMSSWRNRLREIRRLRDKFAPEPSSNVALHSLGRELNNAPSSAPPSAANTPGISEAPSQNTQNRESAVFRRKSTTFFGLGAPPYSTSGENSRQSMLSNDADTENSGSTASRDG